MANNISEIKKAGNLKIHLLLFTLDSLALGTYFGFEALSEIEIALSKNYSEIIIDEGAFYIFILLGLVFFHLIIAISIHTPISKSIYKEKFAGIAMLLGFVTFFFSGYFVSNYVESKLIKADYHFCENLSYSGNYKSTHYVWRAKNTNCSITINNPPTQQHAKHARHARGHPLATPLSTDKACQGSGLTLDIFQRFYRPTHRRIAYPKMFANLL